MFSPIWIFHSTIIVELAFAWIVFVLVVYKYEERKQIEINSQKNMDLILHAISQALYLKKLLEQIELKHKVFQYDFFSASQN